MIGLGIGMGLTGFFGSGGGGGWTPATPSGLVALFDSRVGLTVTGGLSDGNVITAWADQSGNGRDTVQNVASTVFYKSTGLSVPAVRFIGSPSCGMKYTAANILTPGGARTILAAAQATSTEGSGCLFTNRLGDHGQASAFLNAGGHQYYHGDFLTYSGELSPQTTDTDAPFSSAHVYTGAGNAPNVQINGTTRGVIAGTQGTEDGTTGFMLGSMSGTATYTWTGYVWMIAVYNVALSSADLAAWQAYSAAQFGTP